MKISKRSEQEGILEYADRLSELYATTYDVKMRKKRGQVFTPNQVSIFMADMFEIRHNTIRILDPGAGTGILTAAFCEQILNIDKTVNLIIDAYENDPNVLPFLRMVLESCKIELEKKGHIVEYNIYDQDFILHNVMYFKKSGLLWNVENRVLYDFIISNPPYYKINKDSQQSIAMAELISGQPNIYILFMALSASMTKPDGELVFITPRSFCSGLYYKKFRKWFLNNVQITDIHIFESRTEIFNRDEVLQENIIIKAVNNLKKNKCGKLIISTSKNKDFNELKRLEVPYSDIICNQNGELFIRIPTSPIDVDILHAVDKLPNTLKDLGLGISTGPVVPFRAKQYLLPELTEKPKSAPLLWMHNMQDMKVVWHLKRNKKESAIQVCGKTIPLLLPVKNYILLKRFSSKEQKRRLHASVLLESKFPYKTVGIENHVNYIHRSHGNLSVHEALGIAAILNTTIIDNFFRSVNGNTQVNATDIRSLPFPTIEEIRKIGELVYEYQSYQNGYDLDNIVAAVMGIDAEIIKKLNNGGTE
jgi:adenine-specific DNA-methyltransferase